MMMPVSPTYSKSCDINANGYEYFDENQLKENTYIGLIHLKTLC